MLLRPANTLLLDEPTNHLDMDSKDVLLDALEDFGGTLILVSHDRYFIDKLATKIIDVGGGAARVYPGGYEEYRWSLAKREEEAAAKAIAAAKPPAPAKAAAPKPAAKAEPSASVKAGPPTAHQKPMTPPQGVRGGTAGQKPGAAAVPATAGDGRDERKRQEAEDRRRKRAREAVEGRIATLEAKIAEHEAAMKTLEATMSAPGFYEDHDTSKPTIDRHQALMWELGDLMHRWEELQQELEAANR
jgi:ATP-binding cassette subfamily F protein 3